MTPWPTTEVQTSPFAMPPTTSPTQQTDNNQDPFAAYGAGPGPGIPQFNQAPPEKQPPQQLQQQPPAPVQQQPGNADPWAAMAPVAQMPMLHAPPAAPGTTPPNMTMAPPAMAQPHLTPPPAMVVTDAAGQVPPSPIGDQSVIAAMNNNAAPQRLQPAPQPQPMMVAAPTQAPPAPANPFDFGGVSAAMPQAPPPAAMPPQAPPSPTDPNAAPTQQPYVQTNMNMISPPVSPVPHGAFSPQNSQQFADPFGYAFSPMTSPVTSPVTSPNGSPHESPTAMVPSAAAPGADPFGVFGGQIPPAGAGAPAPYGMPMMPGTQAPAQAPPMAPVQAPVQAMPQAMVPSAAPSADPFGAFGSQPAAAPANADPFGAGTMVTSAAPAGGVSDDPFGIFGAATPAPVQAPAIVHTQAPAAQQAPVVVTPKEEDPWAAAGFGQAVSHAPQPPHNPDPRLESNQQNLSSSNITTTPEGNKDEVPITLDSNNLPSEGEYYEARINARSLGAMFYTARNLEETLYNKMPSNVIEALGSRPVVAYVAEGSAAYNSGIHLGHVILSVNGHEISDPEYCANTIRTAPRPMTLRCYVPPSMELTLNEGKHMVKYDTKGLEAPGGAMEWKRKYVVIGGIVTKPWMMNMFYAKKDYDTAVKEAHAGHKISVKVKQFDLRGARIILKGRDGKPNWVNYPSERRQWYYITILPDKGYPIKISSESLEDLEPVYAAVRRFVRKDMESRYSYHMEESFGSGTATSNRSNSARSNSARSNSGVGPSRSNSGFEGFGNAPGPQAAHDYWR